MKTDYGLPIPVYHNRKNEYGTTIGLHKNQYDPPSRKHCTILGKNSFPNSNISLKAGERGIANENL